MMAARAPGVAVIKVPSTIESLEEERPAARSIETFSEYATSQQVSKRHSILTTSPQRHRSTKRTGKLRELKRLYGRSQEQQIIADAYKAAIRGIHSDKANVVIVKGGSGTGKTVVAQSIRQRIVEEDHGFFVTWKFHHESQIDAGSAGFAAAFTSLSQQILAAGDDVLQQIRQSIQAIGAADTAVILEMIPAMEPIIGTADSNTKSNGIAASGRQLEIMKAFVRAISTKERPLVFLFDDIQFSDSCTQMFFDGLISDTKNDGFLCIVTVGPEEPIAPGMDKLLESFQESCITTTVELANLDAITANLMVADILHVDEEVSAPMTNFLHQYTKGNPQFVIEILRLMFDYRVLTFDEESCTWNTDDERMGFICECKDFNALTAGKLDRLQQPVKEMLKAAACIGTEMDVAFLDIIMSAPVSKHMNIAVASGLVITVDKIKGIYRFATNRAREAAYSLIPVEELEVFHLAVGRKLLHGFSDDQLQEHKSIIIGQMKRGAKMMTNSKEQYAIASLCLKAAEKAVEWSMFPTAADSLDLGISLLGIRCWREEYDLSLAIYNCAAEVGYAIGAFAKVAERIEAVLKNARVFDHKLQAIYVKISLLSATAKVQESIDVGLETLKKIGEPISPHPSRSQIMREYFRSHRSMKNRSSDMLLRLPRMIDHRKAAAMQIINLIILPAIFGRSSLMPLLAMRATQITVSHGLCAISAVAFGLYGMVLTTVSGEVEEATRFGELALQLLDRFDSKQWLSRVHVAVYGCIFGWTKGVVSCIEPLKRGYDVGIESGDIEYAMLNGNIRTTYMLCTGTPLSLLKKEMLAFTGEVVDFNQEAMLRMHKSTLHMIEAFMEIDCSKALSHLLQGEGEFITTHDRSSDFSYDCWFGFKKPILVYLMGDYTGAASQAEAMVNVDLLPIATVDVSVLVTVDGLARIAYSNQTGKKKRRTLAVARKRLKRMEKHSKICPSFCSGLTYFLKAEIAWLAGKHTIAPEYYFTSVSLLGRVKMLLFHAMASERAARYMLACGKLEKSKEYFQESVSVLDEWGAQGKRDALVNEMSTLFDMQKE